MNTNETRRIGPACPAWAPSQEWMDSSKPVLLTFDDGPSESCTPSILDTLSRNGVKALFFVLGHKLETAENRKIVERIIVEGHMVGNHSYTHANLVAQTHERIFWEINQTQKLLESVGARERIFRPPFGNANQQVFELVRQARLWGLGWTADTADWNETYQPNGWILHGFKQVRSTCASIVLLHDIHQTTANGLSRFIELLRKAGCSFPPLFSEQEPESPKSTQDWRNQQPGWMVIPELSLFRPYELDGESGSAARPPSTLAALDNSAG